MVCVNGVPLCSCPTTFTYDRYFVCNHCGKVVSGGEYILGVFYCPMCASIIHKNNRDSKEFIPITYPVIFPTNIPLDKRITY